MGQNLEDRVQKVEDKVQPMEIKLAGVDTQFNVVKEALIRIEATLVKMDTDLTSKYVTKTEFDVVRNIVFGMVTIILISVVGALITTVVIHPSHDRSVETTISSSN